MKKSHPACHQRVQREQGGGGGGRGSGVSAARFERFLRHSRIEAERKQAGGSPSRSETANAGAGEARAGRSQLHRGEKMEEVHWGGGQAVLHVGGAPGDLLALGHSSFGSLDGAG